MNIKSFSRVMSGILAAALLSVVCFAESAETSLVNDISYDNEYYKMEMDGEFLFLTLDDMQVKQTAIAPIPDGMAYHFMQEINGKYVVRVVCSREFELYSPNYLSFDIARTFVLDTNVANPTFREILLNQYGSRLVLLNNDHWVAKQENGQYQLFRPDGSEIELQIDYGSKLELAKRSPEHSQATYQGMSLDYDPYSNRYVMLLGLNPYYKTDGSDVNREITGPLYLAVFYEDGSVDKIMKIPDIRGIATAPKLNEPIPQPPKPAFGEMPEDYIMNYQFAMEFFPNQLNQVLLDNTYLIDWKNEKVSEQKIEKKSSWSLPFESQYPIALWSYYVGIPSTAAVATKWEATEDGGYYTGIYYPQSNKTVWERQESFSPLYFAANEDGTINGFMIS